MSNRGDFYVIQRQLLTIGIELFDSALAKFFKPTTRHRYKRFLSEDLLASTVKYGMMPISAGREAKISGPK